MGGGLSFFRWSGGGGGVGSGLPCSLKWIGHLGSLTAYFQLPDSDYDSDSDMVSCNIQEFSIGSDLDPDPLIEM